MKVEGTGPIREGTARITAAPDGRYLDANEAALDLLGVTFEELLASPPGRFSAEPADPASEGAFRRQWEHSGAPDLGGQATVVRADGRQVRVRFAIGRRDDGQYEAILEAIDGRVDQAAHVYTLGEVLAAWRAAERRLEVVAPGGGEWATIQAEIAAFRAQYQQLFGARRAKQE